MRLSVQNISHRFGEKQVLRDVSFEVESGEIACLVGPSGSGKSTLLRLIAGIGQVQEGRITLDGVELGAKGNHVETRNRGIGMVFQAPNLFPHLTVADNIAFGLGKKSAEERKERVRVLLKLIGLPDKAVAYPHELSGGQQQRVALARALAPEPKVMLLDEPFANLDQMLRVRMREEVLSVLKETGIPVILVTHEPEEALVMADKMVLLRDNGTLHQYAAPHHIYSAPVDAEAAAFFGAVNVQKGKVREGGIHSILGQFVMQDTVAHVAEGEDVTIITRPETFMPRLDGAIELHVVEAQATATGWLVTGAIGGEEVKVLLPYSFGSKPRAGEAFRMDCLAAHIFPLAS